MYWDNTDSIIDRFDYYPIRANNAGELVYTGPSLHEATGLGDDDDANYSLTMTMIGTKDMRIDMRVRRLDENNYIAFRIDFPDNDVKIVKVVGGTETVLATADRTFEYQGVRKYRFAVWTFGRFIYGFVNGDAAVRASTPKMRTEPGISLNFPTVDADDPARIYALSATEVIGYPAPSLPSDNSDLYLQHRLMIKEAIENPSERTWATYRTALQYYEQRHFGRLDHVWAELGYPIKKPTPEEWFGES